MKKLFPLLLAAACFTASAQIEVDFSQGEDVADLLQRDHGFQR